MNIYTKEPAIPAQACIIWMHGLGSDAQNMMNLVNQLTVNHAIRHIFLNAPIRPVTINQGIPMRAWYDITGFGLTNRDDREGLSASSTHITNVIQQQLSNNLLPQQIFLAGFSQGGAMALYTGLQLQYAIGGIIALSAYLPLATEHAMRSPEPVPVFFGVGTTDSIVLPEWSKQVYSWLLSCNFQDITWHEYAMEHSICAREIRDLSQWIENKCASTNGAIL